MDRPANIEELLNSIEAQDLSQTPGAIREAAQVAKLLVRKSVEALLNARDPDLKLWITENLSYFGSMIVEELEREIHEIEDRDTQTYAADLLLLGGSEEGVPYLIRALKCRSRNAPLIATHLSWTRDEKYAPSIRGYLQSTLAEDTPVKMRDSYLLLRLIEALERLDTELSEDEKSQMAQRMIEALHKAVETRSPEGDQSTSYFEAMIDIFRKLDLELPREIEKQLIEVLPEYSANHYFPEAKNS